MLMFDIELRGGGEALSVIFDSVALAWRMCTMIAGA